METTDILQSTLMENAHSFIQSAIEYAKNMENVIPNILFTLLGVVLGTVLSEVVRIIQTHRNKSNKIKKLLEAVRNLEPTNFIHPSCYWRQQSNRVEIKDDEQFFQLFSDFLESGRRILVVTGSYGIGKSFLCRHLAAILANRVKIDQKSIPIYINSQILQSEDISFSVIQRINTFAGIDLSQSEFFRLIERMPSVVFFDSLDQLPFVHGENNRIDQIIEFALDHFKNYEGRGKIVLVVREQFLQYNEDVARKIALPEIDTIEVLGFKEMTQIYAFIHAFDTLYANERIQKIEEILKRAPHLVTILKKPIVLNRFAAISIDNINVMASIGTTLTKIFELSFGDIDPQILQVFYKISYVMFLEDRYDILLSENNINRLELSKNEVAQFTKASIVNNIKGKLYQFEHALYRDYFVAKTILNAVIENNFNILSKKQNNYLVSEFLAGLLDTRNLINLLGITTKEEYSATFRINIIDILSELEQNDLRSAALKYFNDEIERLKTSEMTEYKMALCTNAGCLGNENSIMELIKYVEQVGFDIFKDHFFATKNHFAYYDGSQDICISEWRNILQQKKYKSARLLVAFFLGEMKAAASLPELQKIVQSNEEELHLRIIAQKSLAKIIG